MTSKPPPIPKENVSPKGTGENEMPNLEPAPDERKNQNLDKKGQRANTKQNTKHQGYQQDR
jgi:hypothetical protein